MRLARTMWAPKHGVISLLDPRAAEQVRTTWSRLEREFGLRGVLIMPFPHFTYQIAGGYERPAIEDTLAELARQIPPFEVTTTGISTFGGDWPVVYVAIDANPSLRSLHETLWDRCRGSAQDPVEYYRPGTWVPHITLAHGDEPSSIALSRETVTHVVRALEPAGFRWQVKIDNLALVWDEGTVQRPVATFLLRGT